MLLGLLANMLALGKSGLLKDNKKQELGEFNADINVAGCDDEQ